MTRLRKKNKSPREFYTDFCEFDESTAEEQKNNTASIIFDSAFNNSLKNVNTKSINDTFWKTAELKRKTKYTTTHQRVRVIFVFDEARFLNEKHITYKDTKVQISFFRLMRRVMGMLRGDLFVLFLDTLASINKTLPSQKNDPCARRIIKSEKTNAPRNAEQEEKPFESFSPIYLLPTWDLYASKVDIEITGLQDAVTFKSIYSLGRPLTSATYHIQQQDRFKNIPSSSIIDLYKNKLTAGAEKSFDATKEEQKYTNADILAIIGARIGVVNPLKPALSMELVGSHLAILTHISSDRDIAHIEYFSEPAIAEAARSHMLGRWPFFMSRFHELVTDRQVSTGEKGEDITLELLLCTMDSARQDPSNKAQLDNPKQCLEYVTVRCFLSHLYKPDSFAKVVDIFKKQFGDAETDIILNEYYVSFNHCIRANVSIDKFDLDVALRRNAIIRCKQNQSTIDYAIVAVKGLTCLNEKIAFLIQTKLTDKSSKLVADVTNIKEVHQLFGKSSMVKPIYPFLFFDFGRPKENEIPGGVHTKISKIREYLARDAKDKMLDYNTTNGNTNVHQSKENMSLAVIYSRGIAETFNCIDEKTAKVLQTFAQDIQNQFVYGDINTKILKGFNWYQRSEI